MADASQLPAPYNIIGTGGAPYQAQVNSSADFTDPVVVILGENDVPFLDACPTVTQTDDSVLIEWDSDATTAAMVAGRVFGWALKITTDDGEYPVVAGTFQMVPATTPGASTSSEFSATVLVGTVTIDLTVVAGGIGPAGPQGDTGPTGPQGDVGPAGAQGAAGSQGAAGPQGATGSQGALGPQGAVGTTGPQGAVGAQGAAGTNGSTGAQGAAGAQGSPGAQGAVGVQGSPGAQGAVGSQGAIGAQGSPGVQGATGAQGAVGTTGTTGAQGAVGAQGATGTTGAQGAVGTTGAQGAVGAQGAQGASGLNFAPQLKSANYTAAAFESVDATAGSGGFNVTMPSPAASGGIYPQVIVKKVDAGVGTITVAPHASETFDGATALVAPGDVVQYRSDGTNWRLLTPFGTSLALNTSVETIGRQVFPQTGAADHGGNRDTNAAAGIAATDMPILNQTGAWIADSNSWTRTANTTFTITGNQTATYVAGVIVKWQESGVQKYGIVASSAFSTVTTVTLISTSSYLMAANPDGNTNFYANSWIGMPSDFPDSFLWSNAAITGFTGTITGASTATFSIKPGRRIVLNFAVFGTSNATTMTATTPLPSSAAGASNNAVVIGNNTAIASGGGLASITASSSTVTFTLASLSGATFTASGTKAAFGQLEYGY